MHRIDKIEVHLRKCQELLRMYSTASELAFNIITDTLKKKSQQLFRQISLSMKLWGLTFALVIPHDSFFNKIKIQASFSSDQSDLYGFRKAFPLKLHYIL